MKQIINYILLLLPVAALSQQEPVLALDSILGRIERNSPALEAYDLQEESYKYRAEAATAWMAPMVGAGTFMTPYPGGKVMGDREKGNIMFQFEQNIPNAAKLRARKKYILSQGDAVAANKAIAFNMLRSQAKQHYYTWMIAKNKISVLKENRRLLETMLKVEEVRYPYNQSKLSGVYTIQARMEDNENIIRMQEGLIERSRISLLALMNSNRDERFQIDSVADTHFVPDAINDTSAIAGIRDDIVKMNRELQSMRFNIESMKSEKKPDFRIRFDHMTPLAGSMPNAFSVMGMISIPIVPWASKMYKSEIRAMEYNIASMEKQREDMLLQSKGMLNAIQAEIQTMHDRVISMEEKIIPALKKSLDANYLLYQENKLPLQELIESWEALNMMHLTLLDEKLKHYEMIIDYEEQLFQ